MAHADIMHDPPAITQGANGAQEALRRQIIGVVISGGDLFAMGRHHDIADRQQGAVPGACDILDHRECALRFGEWPGAVGHVAGRDEGDEHAVDLFGMHGHARQAVAAFQLAKTAG